MGQQGEVVYQFYRQFNYPVYISSEALSENHSFWQALEKSGSFQKLSATEITSWKKEWSNQKGGKVLVVENLSSAPNLTYSAGGQETIWAEKGHYVYHCKGTALLTYSFPIREWRLGLLPNDTSAKKYQLIVIRYLSWAFASMQGVGVWGTPFDKGVMITGGGSESSETTFLDVRSKRFLGFNGQSGNGEPFYLYRGDNCLSEMRRMSSEEIYGLLMARTSFLHPMGIPLELRDSMMKLSKQSLGTRLPQKIAVHERSKALSD